jgi:CheY-like chemotaxis protein
LERDVPISVLDFEIERVAIVDDKPDVRQSFSYSVQDLKLTPVLQTALMATLGESVIQLQSIADAALCDFQLRVSKYATFDGAELVAALYQSTMPAVLCTRFEKSDIDKIRKYRRSIPCLLNPNELDEDSLLRGFEVCVNEFKQEFTAARRSWRAVIRVQSVEVHHVHVFVPAWSSREGLRLLRSDIPEPLASKLADGLRCHAKVNLGATRQEDLYFTDWEA